ncbi:MAG: hypothetical protein ACRDMX_12345 [Solirubrobacteraceae bacterium]
MRVPGIRVSGMRVSATLGATGGAGRAPGRQRLGVRCVAISAAVLTAGAVLVGASSAAAMTWSAPVTVSGSDSFPAPSQNGGARTAAFGGVAMDAAGDAVATWMSYADANYDCPCYVRAALRPAGGAFGAPVTLSPAGEAGIGQPGASAALQGFPRVAMDAAGDAIVVWSYDTDPSGGLSSDEQVYASVRPAGSQFADPVQVSTAARGGGSPLVAMDSAGDAEVMYVSWDDGDQVTRVEVAARPAGGAFDAPQLVTGTAYNIASCCDRANLAMSAGGRAAIAVDACSATSYCNSGSPADGTEEVLAATAPAGGAFGTPVAVSPSVAISATHPFGLPPMEDLSSVAIDDQGDTAVLYNDWPSQDSTTAMAATSDAGGAFSPTPATLGTAGSSFPYSVALLGDRTAVAEIGTASGPVEVATRPTGGAFGAPAAVPGTSAATTPAALATAASLAGASGDVLAPLLTSNGAGDASLGASIGSAAGAFDQLATLSASTGGLNDGGGVASAIDKAGDQAVVMWQDGSGPMKVSIGGPPATSPPPSPPATSPPASTPPGSTSGPGPTPSGPSRQARRPNTRITGRSVNGRHRTATFKFKAIGSATGFQCALVTQPKRHQRKARLRFARCRSPKTYNHLARGGHYTFYVRAVGAAGSDRTPASVRIGMRR